MKNFIQLFIQSYVAATLIAVSATAYAQDVDEMAALLDSAAKPEKEYAYATFKATRVVNGHSVELMRAWHLDVRIAHRFGAMDQGLYDMFGLDQASARLALEYGVTDWLMAGLGRNTLQKTYDGFLKARVLRQSKGGAPVTVAALASAAVRTLDWPDESRDYPASARWAYTYQALVASKLSERFSVQLSPTLVHRNLVTRKDDEHDVLALGAGGRVKLARRVSLNLEYFALMPGQTADDFQNTLAVGFDIETGGHVFQLHFTNTQAMYERAFIAENPGDWSKQHVLEDLYFGFNLSRVFSLAPKPRRPE